MYVLYMINFSQLATTGNAVVSSLAHLQLQLSLEAEEIREKLTLAKLENRTLQAKLEFFL